MNECFLVLGIPRSGTSIVSRLLHLSGISMGERCEEHLNPEWNINGMYEDVASAEIVTGILNGLRIENHRIASANPVAVEMYRAYIRRRSLEGVWGLKQYHLSVFLEDFVEWCGECDVSAIVTRRNFSESVMSLTNREGRPPDRVTLDAVIKRLGDDLWWLDQGLIRFTGRVLEIDFQSLIQHPYTVVEGLCRFLDRPFSAALVEEVLPASKRLGPRQRPANRWRIDTTPTVPDAAPRLLDAGLPD